MALTLGPQVRQEIERRRRKTHDQRIAQRLSAVLWVAGGRTQHEAAELLGLTERQGRKGLRLVRTMGLEALCTLRHQGDPGKLRPAQVERLKAEIATGRSLTAQRIGDGIDETFHIHYTPRGVRDLRHRVGVSYHKATGFFWKAHPTKPEEFIHTSERPNQEADGQEIRRYVVDACHPAWGAEMLSCCWLPVGPRFLVGVGGGRKRLNIVGASGPDDHEDLDPRLSRDTIKGQQFGTSLRPLRARHPGTTKFLLDLDNAKYDHAAVVQEWLARHPEFHLEFLPADTPNRNLIERLWKLVRMKAFTRWHQAFEGREAAVSAGLDHVEDYRAELTTLRAEKFQRHPQAKAVTGQSVAA